MVKVQSLVGHHSVHRTTPISLLLQKPFVCGCLKSLRINLRSHVKRHMQQVGAIIFECFRKTQKNLIDIKIIRKWSSDKIEGWLAFISKNLRICFNFFNMKLKLNLSLLEWIHLYVKGVLKIASCALILTENNFFRVFCYRLSDIFG